MAAGENRLAPEMNEKEFEVIELLENATPGASIKKATKYGVKIFHDKTLKTFF